jgi:hypothetical protein
MWEIATGLGILMFPDPTPWIWGRVCGDALDTGTLAAHLNDHNPEEETHRLSVEERPVLPAHDYRDRRGIMATVAPTSGPL